MPDQSTSDAAPLAEWAEARVRNRHGRERIFESLTATRCALVVVDMQVAFADPAARVVPAVNRLSAALRERGGLVCFTRHTVDPDSPWLRWREVLAPSEEAAAELVRGAPGHAALPGLRVEPDDLVVEKTRFSAFFPGAGPDLDGLLRGRGIDTVLVAGALANVCCESTARDAMQLDYRTLMISDATIARRPDLLAATLATIRTAFGDVTDVATCLSALQ